MQPQQWLSSGQYFSYQNHRLFYIDSDPNNLQKPILLMVHGFPTSSYDWHKVWPQLTENFRCIAMDMLGFGYSDKPKQHRYSIHEQADLQEELLHRLEITSLHLLAHDYGDTVAQELLARDNSREKKLFRSTCLLNGGLFPETHKARPIQKLLISPIGPLINLLVNYRQFCRSFKVLFGPATKPTETELRELWQIIQYNGGKYRFHKLINYMQERLEYRQRWLDALNQYPGPLQLINGSYDPVSGAHMVARFRELIERPAGIVELAKVGHYPQWEAPELLASTYLGFIENHSKKVAPISL
ncbi:haloalkane dehalogenase 2 [Microbulbifer sp. NBRC 101763]|uniref:alpha/beta fold hydrolase n=1 Tax=unclassified Microbulbifer TaxID=2619833 RepID=UPI003099FC4E